MKIPARKQCGFVQLSRGTMLKKHCRHRTKRSLGSSLFVFHGVCKQTGMLHQFQAQPCMLLHMGSFLLRKPTRSELIWVQRKPTFSSMILIIRPFINFDWFLKVIFFLFFSFKAISVCFDTIKKDSWYVQSQHELLKLSFQAVVLCQFTKVLLLSAGLVKLWLPISGIMRILRPL